MTARPSDVIEKDKRFLRPIRADWELPEASGPRRSEQIELLGVMQDSGFDEPPWLICYADAHYIQATKLLYHVLLFADGHTPIAEIATRVRDTTSIEVSTDDVAWLVENRLAPSGLLESTGSAGTSGDEHDGESEPESLPPGVPAQGRVDVADEAPMLGIRFRLPLFPYPLTKPITSLLQYLYWAPLMAALVIVAVAVNVAVFLNPALVPAIGTVLFRPELMLLLVGIEFASVLFHELGHASALRRANCRYGTIGVALYVIWPVFYTDVTHVYRLNRAQRIRVDLGGIYFQLISMIGMYVIYLRTGAEVLLLAIFFTLSAFLQQFTPFLRFDGYYTVADIMGVNEPLSLVLPFIRDRLPWNRHREKLLPPMRRSARLAFSTYLLVVVAFLAYPFVAGAFAGSTIVRETLLSGQFYWEQMTSAFQAGNLLALISASLQGLMWALIPIGLVLFVGRILIQLTKVSSHLVGLGLAALERRRRLNHRPLLTLRHRRSARVRPPSGRKSKVPAHTSSRRDDPPAC